MSKPLCPVCGRDARFTHVCRNGVTMDPSLLDPQTFGQKVANAALTRMSAEALHALVCQLRADLATVTADAERLREKNDGLGRARDTARAELAEVRKELEEMTAARERLNQDWKRRHTAWLDQQAREVSAHGATRTELSAAQERVKTLEAQLKLAERDRERFFDV